jgi:malonate transporter
VTQPGVGCPRQAAAAQMLQHLADAVHHLPPPPPGSLFNSDSLTSLFSTLFTTFGVIAIGYAAKRTGYFSREAKAGLGELVGKVALPALLFRAIATLQLSDLKAEFIVGVLIAKVTLFVVTIGTAKLAGRGLADAAIWGLFVSNSNDLAQGYPLFLVLYPGYAYQLFITAAMQVAILNPVAILLLEVELARRSGLRTSLVTLVRRVLLQVARNPLVLCVFLGGIANRVWAGEPPQVLTGPMGILTILGSAFMGSALLLTGYVSAPARSEVRGDTQREEAPSLAVPLYLTVLKSLIFPMVCRVLVGKMHHLLSQGPGLSSLLDLAFLYGTLPTAPSTIVIAQVHGVSSHTIVTAAVLNMLVSAPLAFTSTVLMSVSRLELLEQAAALLSDLCSVGSALAACWTIPTAAAAARGLAALAAQPPRSPRCTLSPLASPPPHPAPPAAAAAAAAGTTTAGEASSSRLHVIAHLAAAQLLFSLSRLGCQAVRRIDGGRIDGGCSRCGLLSVLVQTGCVA